ncbi:hypothetical protein [Mesorhizobium sp. IMUNJ 23232]|uniref:hypothetical protein n=1 Tax=Mesorhizobium sp. IMUNJ 23232 TaxID=3376064 RepID=UPI0037A831D9
MIPILLEWKKPKGKVVLERRPWPDVESAQYECVVAEGGDVDIALRSINLENPIALKYINCRTDDDLLTFVSLYGDPFGFGDLKYRPVYRYLTDTDYLELALFALAGERQNRNRSHIEAVLHDIRLKPVFEFFDSGKARVIMSAPSLYAFMAMEVAAAGEAGATLRKCAHCQELFLIGPMTNRRDTAIYCRDRCRVYASRARKAGKGGRDVGPET